MSHMDPFGKQDRGQWLKKSATYSLLDTNGSTFGGARKPFVVVFFFKVYAKHKVGEDKTNKKESTLV